MIRRGSLLSNAWLVSGVSVATVAVLVVLLWSMGSRPSVSGKSLRLFCAAGISKPLDQRTPASDGDFPWPRPRTDRLALFW